MKRKIVILCGGVPKPGRAARHMELYGGRPLIDKNIDTCSIPGVPLYVLMSKENHKLRKYVKEYKEEVKIIEPVYDDIISTFKTALSIEGDIIFVCGDLVSLEKKHVQAFLNSPYDSAIGHYKIPWGVDIKAKNSDDIRKGNIGDAISMIAHKHKKMLVGNENIANALHYHYLFRGTHEYNLGVYNDIGTMMMYSFFYIITSGKSIVDTENNIGTVYFEEPIYNDND